MTNLWVSPEDLGVYADSDYALDAAQMASHILWAFSGRKFNGINTVTERYVTEVGSSGFVTYSPALLQGTVVNLPTSSARRTLDSIQGDGTTPATRVRLRGRKVTAIHAVRDMLGNIVDPTTYYLGDHSVMYGIPGCGWDASAVEVTYSYGTRPPRSGEIAAKLLALEFVKAFEGDEDCALPKRVTNVTRQGVSFTILDNQEFLDDLKTGIYAVDLFLKAVNPDKARARARVFSPDVPRAKRVTGKPYLIQPSASDLFVQAEGGSVTRLLSAIGAESLLDDPSWVLSATISDWTGTRSATLDTDPSINDAVIGSETLTVSAGYREVLGVLGTLDPGILDVYATRPSIGNPSVPEIILVMTANVAIRLGHVPSTVYSY